jgi:hypothetical protein
VSIVYFAVTQEGLKAVEEVLARHEKYYAGTKPRLSVRENDDTEDPDEVTLYFGNEEYGVELYQDGSVVPVGG